MKPKLEMQGLKSDFLKNVSLLAGGTASAQVLLVLASPLLTRIYTPDDFGLLAVYSALLALFLVISSLRYEMAIPLPESNKEAVHIVILSLIVVTAMTCVSSLMVLLFGTLLAEAVNLPNLAEYFWLLPIGVFFAGIYRILNYWAVRQKSFRDITITRISQTLTTLAIQFSFYKFGGIALLFSQVSGQGTGCLRLARSALKHEEFKSWTWAGVWRVIKRYKQFPIFSTWSGLFNTTGTQLPPLIVAAFFSANSAGLFALAIRILNIPVSVLGGAIGQVYFSNLAEAKREGRLSELVEKGVLNLLKLALPAGVWFMLVAPDLFAFAFGQEWKVAGEIARWMTPWILCQFISSPLSTLYFVLEKENWGFYFQSSMLIVRIASLLIGVFYYDFFHALLIFSLSSALCYFLYTINIVMLASVSLKWLFFKLGKELFIITILSLPLYYFYLVYKIDSFYIIATIVMILFYFLRFRNLLK